MIVVCGEALFDVFATGDTPTGMSLDARVGGSPFNVAVGLARLGQPVCLLTQISRGFLGERLMRRQRSACQPTSPDDRCRASASAAWKARSEPLKTEAISRANDRSAQVAGVCRPVAKTAYRRKRSFEGAYSRR
jgi:hypothetical protein